MGIGSIIFIILVGILLMILDFLVIPGGFVAIFGLLCMVGGVVLSFVKFSTTVGFIVLIATAIVAILMFVLMLRSKTWRRLQLNTQIDSRMNEVDEQKIKVGAVGMTMSRLAPMGKGLFEGEIVEISSVQDFIEENTQVEVVKIDGCKIIVKPLNK